MKKLLPNDSYLEEAKKAKFKPNVVVQILMCFCVLILTQLAVGIFANVFTAIYTVCTAPPNFNFGDTEAFTKLINSVSKTKSGFVIQLFVTAIAIFLTIIYCKYIEKRSLKSMGFVKKSAGKKYLIGLLIGFVQFSMAVVLCLITGTLKYKGMILGENLVFIILFLFGFLIQGMEEEVLCRGYFMASLSNRVPVVAAIMINSVVFAALHLLNSGMSIIPFINLILFGVFASVYAIRTNNLWGVCAIHSMWNFTQSNIYGILCSGQDMKASVFHLAATEKGTIINGGAFGLEGGLAVTIVEILGIAIIFCVTRNKNM